MFLRYFLRIGMILLSFAVYVATAEDAAAHEAAAVSVVIDLGEADGQTVPVKHCHGGAFCGAMVGFEPVLSLIFERPRIVATCRGKYQRRYYEPMGFDPPPPRILF